MLHELRAAVQRRKLGWLNLGIIIIHENVTPDRAQTNKQ
jgi:hypothetical protein